MERAVKGMAKIFWGMVWADVAEHSFKDGECYPMAGIRIEEHAGPPPERAYRLAERLRGHVEEANGCVLWELYTKARKADGINLHPKDYDSPDVERFGDCLAHMAIGSGVSWFDDHAKFPLIVPRWIESYYIDELFNLAVEALAKDGYVFSEKDF